MPIFNPNLWTKSARLFIPKGNFVVFACCRPVESLKLACQPSSSITYWYPAFDSPDVTRVWAVFSITLWLYADLNVFQLFHPTHHPVSRYREISLQINVATICGTRDGLRLTHLWFCRVHARKAERCERYEAHRGDQR